MKVVKKRLQVNSKSDMIRIIPLGDVHIGAAACDEKKFETVVKVIEQAENTYWLGMGDYCDFINRSDKRYNPMTVAEWCRNEADIVRVQRDRFLDIVKPIAHKCLALVEGNHESEILRKYERDIYSEIVTEIKEAAGLSENEKIGTGIYGWLHLVVEVSTVRVAYKINLHHGFVGGRLAGAKALNMQRWLWSHDADLVLFGHSHNTGMQIEQADGLDRKGNPVKLKRIGAYTGTFLNTTGEAVTYAEAKGYLPMPTGYIEIILRPGFEGDKMRIAAGA